VLSGGVHPEQPRQLEGDVDAVRRALGRVSSPAILVGHSYGGTVITAAGTDDRVAGLVYIAALAVAHIEIADGRIWLPRTASSASRGDLSEEEQKVVWATQGVPATDLFDQRVGGTAWSSKPSWYIVAKQDRAVQPELERFCAKRMDATTYEADSSHVPMLSNPGLALGVIRTAAKSVQGRC
jgi:pimeloyl-ACP methyl ester carboxylesterase